MTTSPDIIKDFSRLQAECHALGESNVRLAQQNVKLKADLQNAWVKCQAVMMDLLDRGETWESLIDWVEDHRDHFDPQKVGNLSNVRDRQAPLASGATPCASKERDRSPGGTGLCCIALFAVSLCGCAGPKIDYASRAEYWKNYRHTDGTKCPEAESNAKWYEQNTTN